MNFQKVKMLSSSAAKELKVLVQKTFASQANRK
ncbi:UNVERIFIED_CONTAM: hypothetical protein GTU68_002146 [Idotea baltica]|nr:hypothetical protein [Idotea baltica]